MEVTLLTGQTIWDLALSYKGSWEAGVDMARGANVSMTAFHQVGTAFPLPSKTYDRTLERYVLTHRLQTATAAEAKATELRIFSSAFSEAFS